MNHTTTDFFMKQILLLATALVISMRAAAQGGNVGMGGKEGDFESLSQRVANLEKKNDAFNVYL